MYFQQLFWYWQYSAVSKQHHDNLNNVFIDMGKNNWECYAITRDKIYFKKKKTGIIYNLISFGLGGILIYNIVKSFQEMQ